MQGVIYTRVSSDEQVKGTSLEYQEESCRKYCQERGVEVLAVFREEGVSAKTADRTELLRALEYCRKHRGHVQAFVFAKVDRFARNTEDHFYVRKLLQEYGVTLHSVSEPIGNSPTEKFVETVLAASSEFDNAVRKQRCTDGMLARLRQGIWPWKPPTGYRCMQTRKRGEKKTRPDPPAPETFPLIQRALREYAKGVIHSQAELARLLDEWGLARARGRRTTPQFVDRMLGTYLNFYAGFLLNPWTGERHQGLQTPMITTDQFCRIRLIRSGQAKVMARDRSNPLFPLRRTVLCGSCNRPLTGSCSRGRTRTYPYYHCSNHDCRLYGKVVGKDALEAAFAHYLDTVTPAPSQLRVFEATVLDLLEEMRRRTLSRAEGSAKFLADLDAKRKRICEMREDGSYTRELFQERLAEVDKEIAVVRSCVGTSQDGEDLDATLLSRALQVIASLRNQWLQLPPALKPRFQKIVLPGGIPYERSRGFGTANLGCIIELNRPSRGQKSQLVDLLRGSWNQLIETLKELKELMSEIPSTVSAHHNKENEADKGVRLAA